jgi:hypothetical protein
MRVRRNLHQVKSRLVGELTRLFRGDNAAVLAVGIDKLNLRNADLVVDPGPFLDGRGSTIGTANGQFSLKAVDRTNISGIGQACYHVSQRIRRILPKSTQGAGSG